MGGFMGSYLVGGRGQEFHLRYTSHMFEKAFDVYFEDLGVGTILVCIWPETDLVTKIQEWGSETSKGRQAIQGMLSGQLLLSVGKWSLSCWGNYGNQCKILTFRVTPPQRRQSWGTSVPTALRAAPVGQGGTPFCWSEQSRRTRLWRKPLVKEMQELVVGVLYPSGKEYGQGTDDVTYSKGNNCPSLPRTKGVPGCETSTFNQDGPRQTRKRWSP